MNLVAFMFHDVVARGASDTSGFPGRAAARYKLDHREFEEHCRAIASVAPPGAVRLLSHDGQARAEPTVTLTFDDGGCSASEHIADALEARGWRAHFFVTTDYVGAPGFLTRSEIRALRARGHGIGTHSCSHPERMSRLPVDELALEWRKSVRVLSDLLGEAVITASVPGGYYSRPVASAAAATGIRLLFTSRPTPTPRVVDGCLVVGRYMVTRGLTSATIAGLAAGRLFPRLREVAWWNVKEMAKTLGGAHYNSLRRALLE